MFASGVEPEIFVFGTGAEVDELRSGGRLTDFSGEAWTRDTDFAYVDPQTGNVIGFPVAIEGWGLGYNKDLLAKAGIDPRTLTNAAALRTAFEQVDAMKDQLGIEAAVSMLAGPGVMWVSGLYGTNAYLALGLPFGDSARHLDLLNKGEVDGARLTSFAEYYDALFRYARRPTLLSGGYNQQVGDFAAGRTAFIHQANLADPTFEQLGAKFEMSYVPNAFLNEDTDGIFASVPAWYAVNAKSARAEDAKKFLAAMAGTPEGHDYLVNKAGMIPAFKSVKLQPSGQLSRAVQEWAKSGKVYAVRQNEVPGDFFMNTLGPVFQKLAAQQIDTAEFARLFTEAVRTMKK
jgi:raffinose/stachyose/melibiose transport system substrate-binding protein